MFPLIPAVAGALVVAGLLAIISGLVPRPEEPVKARPPRSRSRGVQRWRAMSPRAKAAFVVALVLGVDAESHVQGAARREADARALLDYGFNGFDLVRFGHPEVGPIPVYRGEVRQVTPRAPAVSSVVVPAGRQADLDAATTMIAALEAPIPEDAQVGTTVFSMDGIELARVSLQVAQVERAGLIRRTWDSIRLFFARRLGGREVTPGESL